MHRHRQVRFIRMGESKLDDDLFLVQHADKQRECGGDNEYDDCRHGRGGAEIDRSGDAKGPDAVSRRYGKRI